MNACRRTSCNVNDWGHRLTTVFSWTATRGKCRQCPWAQSSQKRSQTTDAKHDPVTEKSRLSAIDLAQKLRENAKTHPTQPPLSQQQRRVVNLKRFSTQLQNVHPNVLAKHLHKSVLYQDNDVVVINKPYGVPVRGTQWIYYQQININYLCHQVYAWVGSQKNGCTVYW